MSALLFEFRDARARIGMKGPGAEQWLMSCGIALPTSPNTWAAADSQADSTGLLVARLGTTEFFLEDAAQGTSVEDVRRRLEEQSPGVYPVLREDAAFQLSGDGVHDVLAQVCNVHFAGLALDSRPVIMTLMLGVAVLVVPLGSDAGGRTGERRYRIWCDPTFGAFIGEAVGGVVVESGGKAMGLPA